MAIRIEKSGAVWTVIRSRYEARNAMDPESAAALREAFLNFERDDSASVAVLWGEGGAFCSGWDLKHVSLFDGNDPVADIDYPPSSPPPVAPLGPTMAFG